MGINLQKGQKIDLTKGGSGLSRIMVGLGWDEELQRNMQSIDCDASAILLNSNGKLYGQKINDFVVYFGNLTHYSGAIVHQGDNLTGEGDGDDEQIMVNLIMIPADVEKIVFVVNIYDANLRGQHFGMIRNAFIRLVNLSSNSEICRFNLSEDYFGMTGLVVGEIYRYKNEWKFNAIGQPVREASRLESLLNMYK